MKRALATFVLACGVASHAAAVEPSIVLVASNETRIYQANNGQIELKEWRANGADFGNAQNAKPLEDSRDSTHLVGAYLANLLDCDLGVSSAVSLNEWVQQESAATDGRWLRRLVTVPVNDSYIMISAQGGQRALILNRSTGQRLPGSPCGAAVKFARISPSEQRVAFVTEDVKAIEFYGRKGYVSWSSRRTGVQSIQIHQIRGIAKVLTISKILDEPLDLMLPDAGNWWLLVATNSSKWWKPAEWIYSVGGAWYKAFKNILAGLFCFW